MDRGQVLEVLATDPDADLDVRAWALRAGHEVVSMTHGEDAVLVFRVRRA
jgi:tRNA 2-thiouridine synthesizing protein A